MKLNDILKRLIFSVTTNIFFLAWEGKMKTFTYTSKSTPGKEYTTTIHDDGAVTCTCPGFIYRQKCRHITEVKADKNTKTKSVVPTNIFRNPMLARALPAGKTIKDYTTNEWVLEEKHDGHRLIIETHAFVPMNVPWGTRHVAYSRGGKVRQLPEHILNALNFLPKGIYDGELLVPGGTSTDVKALDKQDQLQLMLFDVLEVDGADARNCPQSMRREILEAATESLRHHHEIKVTSQHPVSNIELQEIWDRGGEGVIIKNVDQTYLEGKRVNGWVKFKKLAAAELTVTGFEDGKNGPHSTILLRDDAGIDCRVKTRNTNWLKDFAIAAETFVGQRLVISYQEKTRDGKYRHPMADHFTN